MEHILAGAAKARRVVLRERYLRQRLHQWRGFQKLVETERQDIKLAKVDDDQMRDKHTLGTPRLQPGGGGTQDENANARGPGERRTPFYYKVDHTDVSQLETGPLYSCPGRRTASTLQLGYFLGRGIGGPLFIFKAWEIIDMYGPDFFAWARALEYGLGTVAMMWFMGSWVGLRRMLQDRAKAGQEVRQLTLRKRGGEGADAELLNLQVIVGHGLFGSERTLNLPVPEDEVPPVLVVRDGMLKLKLTPDPDDLLEIPMDGKVHSPELMLPFIQIPEDVLGEKRPQKLRDNGFVAVDKLENLLRIPRSVLEITRHGLNPLEQIRLLFVSIRGRDLAVVPANCGLCGAEMTDGIYKEQKNRAFLQCKSCLVPEKDPVPLSSSVEWKMGEEGMVYVKLNPSRLENKMPPRSCKMEAFLDFVYTNSFRLRQPQPPEHIDDIFVCGSLTEYPDWETKLGEVNAPEPPKSRFKRGQSGAVGT